MTRADPSDRLEKLLERAIQAISDLREENRQAHEQVQNLRAIRKDIVTLLTAVKTVVDDVMPDMEKKVNDRVEEYLDQFGTEVRKAIDDYLKRLHERMDQLQAIIEEPASNGNTLEATLRKHAQYKFLMGEPVTAAAEPLPKGSEVVVDGQVYEVGADALKIGTLLYLNTRDGKVYPAPNPEVR